MQKKQLRIKDPALKEHIMERLIQGAEGMFRWVACQIDHLCELPSDAARRRALQSLPRGLRPTYERILDRINGTNKDVRKLVQRSLRWILNSPTPLSLPALCEVISVEEGDMKLDVDSLPDEEEVLRWCSSFVRRDTTTMNIELAHFSVKEFLKAIDPDESPQYAAFRFSTPHDEPSMAVTCLTYLCFHDFDGGCVGSSSALTNRYTEHPFRKYAVEQWFLYARKFLDHGAVFAFVQRLFEPSNTVYLSSWAQEFIWGLLKWPTDREFDNVTSLCSTAGPLHYASMLGLSKLCSWLLTRNCDVEQSSAFGKPIFCALLGGRAGLEALLHDSWQSFTWYLATKDVSPYRYRNEIEVDSTSMVESVRVLLRNGADVNAYYHPLACGHRLLTPLFIATLRALPSAAKLLLETGAICDEWTLLLLEPKEFGLFSQMEESIKLEIVKMIRQENVKKGDSGRLLNLQLTLQLPGASESITTPISALQMEGTNLHDLQNALRTASRLGRTEEVKRLLQHASLDIEDCDGIHGCSALHIASQNGSVDVVKILLDKGALTHHTDFQGRTALLHSAQSSDARCFDTLIFHGSDVATADSQGYTAWHLAAESRNLAVLKILAEINSTGMSSVTLDATTPLLCAARVGSREVIDFLLSLGDNIEARDIHNHSALHFAVNANSIQAARRLLERGCSPCVACDDGSTPLHFANSLEDPGLGLVELLLDHGNKVDHCRLDGRTALHVRCDNLLSDISTQTMLKVCSRILTLSIALTRMVPLLYIYCLEGLANSGFTIQVAFLSGVGM